MVSLGIFTYVYFHLDEFKLIASIDIILLLPLFILSLMILFSNGLLTKYFLESFKVDLSFTEYFGLAAVTAMGNYLAPLRGGVAGKALYLKKKHYFPYTRFLSVYSVCYLWMFLIGGLLGLLGIAIFYIQYNTFSIRLFSFFLMSVILVGLAIALSNYTPAGSGAIARRWLDFKQGLDYIRKNKGLLIKVSFIMFLNYIIMSLQLYFGYTAISCNVPYLAACFMAIVLSFSIVISLTPGNLGIQEAIIGLLSKFFGIGFNEGLMVAGIIRVVTLCVVFSLGPVFSYKLTKS